MKKLTQMQRWTLAHFNGKKTAKYDCNSLAELERPGLMRRTGPHLALDWEITDEGRVALSEPSEKAGRRQ